jgi:molybdopterin-guanine dinucleotide biosynthesis adapter protein
VQLIGIAGFSGSGKTTLIESLLPILIQAGVRTSVIKHAHHEFDVDRPGKDSFRHRAAGAHQVLVSSSRRWALMTELQGAIEPTLVELAAQLAPCELVIVEGFKREPIPKIEVHRSQANTPLLFPHDPHIMAVATDAPLATTLPQLPLNEPAVVAHFLIAYLRRS